MVVDNTFASPYLQQPLALGADIVVHSTTKYVGGHSDAVGGIAVTSDDDRAEALRFLQNAIGSVPGPLDCFLTLRGAKTLAIRMRAALRERARDRRRTSPARPPVSQVLYPGLADARRATRSPRARCATSAAWSRSGSAAAARAADARRCADTGIWSLGESLGGVESLVEHPGAMTHASLDGSGFEVPDDLIRLSVGIEHVDDLLADLERMLRRAPE